MKNEDLIVHHYVRGTLYYLMTSSLIHSLTRPSSHAVTSSNRDRDQDESMKDANGVQIASKSLPNSPALPIRAHRVSDDVINSRCQR